MERPALDVAASDTCVQLTAMKKRVSMDSITSGCTVSYLPVRTASNRTVIYFKTLIVYNKLHVSAQMDHHRVLYKNIKKIIYFIFCIFYVNPDDVPFWPKRVAGRCLTINYSSCLGRRSWYLVAINVACDYSS